VISNLLDYLCGLPWIILTLHMNCDVFERKPVNCNACDGPVDLNLLA
jgi:hypothetical protein